MKKKLSLILALALIMCSVTIFSASAEDEITRGAPTAFSLSQGLYVHAVEESADADAWHLWQGGSTKYFYLPTSAGEEAVDIYNAFTSTAVINGVTIHPGETANVPYAVNKSYTVSAGGSNYTARFMKSNAEAAVFVNSADKDLYGYLSASKSNSSTATGAVVTPDGKVDNTTIKKIKGRGNTTWTNSDKKPFNITYDAKLSIAGMPKGKKYSLLANFQDDSLSRNRVLYDISDAVGMPYASDSRYVDFYVNGVYRGSYQMCEKVEAGGLVYDVDEDAYLDENGNVNADFPFIAEVDASAGDEDYYVTLNNGVKITIKAPEIDYGMPGYDEVKSYVKSKFDAFQSMAANSSADLSQIADIPSVTKLYLINELGKNWDSGVSSCFFTYKPDENGAYKFFGSPVWDYDNAIGNAVGVASDLSNMGVSDYTQYTGWWCRYKGKSSRSNTSTNIINNLARHQQILNAAPEIWFEEFVPAVNHFSGKTYNPIVERDFYNRSHYLSLLQESANMNYTSGWSINTGSWIASHNSLRKASFDENTRVYTTDSSYTSYNSSKINGVFNYMADWFISRAAWLSSQMSADYPQSYETGDINKDGYINISDATEIQRYLANLTDFSSRQYELALFGGTDEVTITNVTNIQKYIANIRDEDPTQPNEPVTQPTEPETQPTTGDTSSYTVTYYDSLNWSTRYGGIYCYYWSAENAAMVSWPGRAMILSGTDRASGYRVYQVTVPADIDYVIFSGGSGTEQTENTAFNGSSLSFYSLNTTSDRGRYYCEPYNG